MTKKRHHSFLYLFIRTCFSLIISSIWLQADANAPSSGGVLVAPPLPSPDPLKVIVPDAPYSPPPQTTEAQTVRAPLPELLNVIKGTLDTAQNGTHMDMYQGREDIIANFNSFNIAKDHSVHLHQHQGTYALFRVTNQSNMSFIDGLFRADANVLLVNPNGLLIGPNGVLDTNAIVLTTHAISDDTFLRMPSTHELMLTAPTNPDAIIANYGTIQSRGFSALVAPTVQNAGIIQGNVFIGSGSQADLSFAGSDLIQMRVSGKLKRSLIKQESGGVLSAKGKKVIISAGAVEEAANGVINLGGMIDASDGQIIIEGGDKTIATVSGTLSAEGTTGKGGKIYLKAPITYVEKTAHLNASSADNQGGEINVLGDHVRVLGDKTLATEGATLDVSGGTGGGLILVGGGKRGLGDTPHAKTLFVDYNTHMIADALNSGNAGDIALWSDDSSYIYGYASASALGDTGNAGTIEWSGKKFLHFEQRPPFYPQLHAKNGKGGTIIIDPDNITIDSSSTPYTGSETVVGAAWISAQLNSNINVTLTATNGITVQGFINYTGVQSNSLSIPLLTLDAKGINIKEDLRARFRLYAHNSDPNSSIFISLQKDPITITAAGLSSFEIGVGIDGSSQYRHVTLENPYWMSFSNFSLKAHPNGDGGAISDLSLSGSASDTTETILRKSSDIIVQNVQGVIPINGNLSSLAVAFGDAPFTLENFGSVSDLNINFPLTKPLITITALPTVSHDLFWAGYNTNSLTFNSDVTLTGKLEIITTASDSVVFNNSNLNVTGNVGIKTGTMSITKSVPSTFTALNASLITIELLNQSAPITSLPVELTATSLIWLKNIFNTTSSITLSAPQVILPAILSTTGGSITATAGDYCRIDGNYSVISTSAIDFRNVSSFRTNSSQTLTLDAPTMITLRPELNAASQELSFSLTGPTTLVGTVVSNPKNTTLSSGGTIYVENGFGYTSTNSSSLTITGNPTVMPAAAGISLSLNPQGPLLIEGTIQNNGATPFSSVTLGGSTTTLNGSVSANAITLASDTLQNTDTGTGMELTVLDPAGTLNLHGNISGKFIFQAPTIDFDADTDLIVTIAGSILKAENPGGILSFTDTLTIRQIENLTFTNLSLQAQNGTSSLSIYTDTGVLTLPPSTGPTLATVNIHPHTLTPTRTLALSLVSLPKMTTLNIYMDAGDIAALNTDSVLTLSDLDLNNQAFTVNFPYTTVVQNLTNVAGISFNGAWGTSPSSATERLVKVTSNLTSSGLLDFKKSRVQTSGGITIGTTGGANIIFNQRLFPSASGQNLTINASGSLTLTQREDQSSLPFGLITLSGNTLSLSASDSGSGLYATNITGTATGASLALSSAYRASTLNLTGVGITFSDNAMPVVSTTSLTSTGGQDITLGALLKGDGTGTLTLTSAGAIGISGNLGASDGLYTSTTLTATTNISITGAASLYASSIAATATTGSISGTGTLNANTVNLTAGTTLNTSSLNIYPLTSGETVSIQAPNITLGAIGAVSQAYGSINSISGNSLAVTAPLYASNIAATATTGSISGTGTLNANTVNLTAGTTLNTSSLNIYPLTSGETVTLNSNGTLTLGAIGTSDNPFLTITTLSGTTIKALGDMALTKDLYASTVNLQTTGANGSGGAYGVISGGGNIHANTVTLYAFGNTASTGITGINLTGTITPLTTGTSVNLYGAGKVKVSQIGGSDSSAYYASFALKLVPAEGVPFPYLYYMDIPTIYAQSLDVLINGNSGGASVAGNWHINNVTIGSQKIDMSALTLSPLPTQTGGSVSIQAPNITLGAIGAVSQAYGSITVNSTLNNPLTVTKPLYGTSVSLSSGNMSGSGTAALIANTLTLTSGGTLDTSSIPITPLTSGGTVTLNSNGTLTLGAIGASDNPFSTITTLSGATIKALGDIALTKDLYASTVNLQTTGANGAGGTYGVISGAGNIHANTVTLYAFGVGGYDGIALTGSMTPLTTGETVNLWGTGKINLSQIGGPSGAYTSILINAGTTPVPSGVVLPYLYCMSIPTIYAQSLSFIVSGSNGAPAITGTNWFINNVTINHKNNIDMSALTLRPLPSQTGGTVSIQSTGNITLGAIGTSDSLYAQTNLSSASSILTTAAPSIYSKNLSIQTTGANKNITTNHSLTIVGDSTGTATLDANYQLILANSLIATGYTSLTLKAGNTINIGGNISASGANVFFSTAPTIQLTTGDVALNAKNLSLASGAGAITSDATRRNLTLTLNQGASGTPVSTLLGGGLFQDLTITMGDGFTVSSALDVAGHFTATSTGSAITFTGLALTGANPHNILLTANSGINLNLTETDGNGFGILSTTGSLTFAGPVTLSKHTKLTSGSNIDFQNTLLSPSYALVLSAQNDISLKKTELNSLNVSNGTFASTLTLSSDIPNDYYIKTTSKITLYPKLILSNSSYKFKSNSDNILLRTIESSTPTSIYLEGISTELTPAILVNPVNINVVSGSLSLRNPTVSSTASLTISANQSINVVDSFTYASTTAGAFLSINKKLIPNSAGLTLSLIPQGILTLNEGVGDNGGTRFQSVTLKNQTQNALGNVEPATYVAVGGNVLAQDTIDVSSTYVKLLGDLTFDSGTGITVDGNTQFEGSTDYGQGLTFILNSNFTLPTMGYVHPLKFLTINAGGGVISFNNARPAIVRGNRTLTSTSDIDLTNAYFAFLNDLGTLKISAVNVTLPNIGQTTPLTSLDLSGITGTVILRNVTATSQILLPANINLDNAPILTAPTIQFINPNITVSGGSLTLNGNILVPNDTTVGGGGTLRLGGSITGTGLLRIQTPLELLQDVFLKSTSIRLQGAITGNHHGLSIEETGGFMFNQSIGTAVSPLSSFTWRSSQSLAGRIAAPIYADFVKLWTPDMAFGPGLIHTPHLHLIPTWAANVPTSQRVISVNSTEYPFQIWRGTIQNPTYFNIQKMSLGDPNNMTPILINNAIQNPGIYLILYGDPIYIGLGFDQIKNIEFRGTILRDRIHNALWNSMQEYVADYHIDPIEGILNSLTLPENTPMSIIPIGRVNLSQRPVETLQDEDANQIIGATEDPTPFKNFRDTASSDDEAEKEDDEDDNE